MRTVSQSKARTTGSPVAVRHPSRRSRASDLGESLGRASLEASDCVSPARQVGERDTQRHTQERRSVNDERRHCTRSRDQQPGSRAANQRCCLSGGGEEALGSGQQVAPDNGGHD